MAWLWQSHSVASKDRNLTRKETHQTLHHFLNVTACVKIAAICNNWTLLESVCNLCWSEPWTFLLVAEKIDFLPSRCHPRIMVITSIPFSPLNISRSARHKPWKQIFSLSLWSLSSSTSNVLFSILFWYPVWRVNTCSTPKDEVSQNMPLLFSCFR